MRTILLIATGGTIASRPTAAGGLAPAITSQELLSCVPELAEFCRIDAIQLYNLDSTNMGPEQWQGIAAAVQENYDRYDGFVITHGTDTMGYTAAALSYMIQKSPKPVVLTGSQKSIYNRETDARNNLWRAVAYACHPDAWGVQIVFDNQVILGTRARKTRTKSFNAFSSIDYPETAMFRDRRLIQFLQRPVRLVQQVDDVRGHDRVKALIRIVQMKNISLRKLHIAEFGALFLCPAQHRCRKIRGGQALAAWRDHSGEQPRAAGAFQHVVSRRDQLPDRGAQRPVRFSVDAVGKNVVEPRNVVPEHEGFLRPSYLSLSFRQKSQQSPPRPSVLVRCQ